MKNFRSSWRNVCSIALTTFALLALAAWAPVMAQDVVGLEGTVEENSEFLFGGSHSPPFTNTLTLGLASGGPATLSTGTSPISGAINQGWWSANLGNNTSNTNYFCGDLSSDGTVILSNFFTFDISGLQGQTVTSAQFNVRRFIGSSSTGQTFHTYSIFDVSTAATVLNNNSGFDAAIPQDLASGVIYGGFNISVSGASSEILHLTLNADAISDINSAISGGSQFFSIGGTLFPAFDLDSDNDGILDEDDNCPFTPNPGQADSDLDGTGNACDDCINDFGPPDNAGCPRPEVPPGTEVANLPSGSDIDVDGQFGSGEWADITPVVTLGGDSITYQALDPDGGDLYLMYDFIGSQTPLAVGEESGVVRFFVGTDVFDVFFIQGGPSGTLGLDDDVRVLRNGVEFDNSLGSIVGAVDFNNSSPNFPQVHNLFELEVVLLQTPDTPGGSPPGDGGLYSPDPAFWGAQLPGSPLVQVSASVLDIQAGGNVVAVVANMIDIKPGSDPNSININSMGVVPVAILGSETFDVTDVDVTTLAFGPGGADPAHDLTDPIVYADHLQDVNDDGFTDLVSHYKQGETDLMEGDMQACIEGDTLGGEPVFGCDSVNVVSGGGGPNDLSAVGDSNNEGGGFQELSMGDDPLEEDYHTTTTDQARLDRRNSRFIGRNGIRSDAESHANSITSRSSPERTQRGSEPRSADGSESGPQPGGPAEDRQTADPAKSMSR